MEQFGVPAHIRQPPVVRGSKLGLEAGLHVSGNLVPLPSPTPFTPPDVFLPPRTTGQQLTYTTFPVPEPVVPQHVPVRAQCGVFLLSHHLGVFPMKLLFLSPKGRVPGWGLPCCGGAG